MKIATILPYKENYSNKNAGAVSLWVSDFMKYSSYKKNVTVFGHTFDRSYLTKNYFNINLQSINSKIFSSTKEYSNNIIKHLTKNYFDIVEIHNRPIMVYSFVKKIDSKIILYLHNDPKTMKGSKTKNEKLFLLEKVDKIIFISEWIKKQFFSNLKFNEHHKTEVIYHSIDPIKKLSKKKKQIVFVGKLNEAKGYDLFCKSVDKVLKKYDDWKAFSIGGEKRLQEYYKNKKQINLGILDNKKVLNIFKESEIAVIPSRWDEPFGRTALESTSRGCATIISNRGGLTETTDDAIVLKNLDSNNIVKELIKLIKNKNLRKKLQISGLKNLKHILKLNSAKIDYMRSTLFPFSNFNTNGGKLRILNIYNLAQKLNHRIYNLSLGKKFTNGFIRNGHDVIEISDRDYIRQQKSLNIFNFREKFNSYLINTVKNYNPDLITFGHTNNLDLDLLSILKKINRNMIISQWNEDPMMNTSIEAKENVNKIKNFLPQIDHTFVTTNPKVTAFAKNNFNNIHYFITPVDKSIECFDVYNLNPQKDLFYAISHGVNRGSLKSGKIDSRLKILQTLIKKLNGIKLDFYGINGREPIWGNDFYSALLNVKMGLNLSRGKPTKHYSSNRIASLMGNGLLTFIDEKVEMDSFFSKNEIIFYKNIDDLASKIKFYSKNDRERIKIAKNGKKKYFKRFNEIATTKYIVDVSTGKINNLYN
ncbi:glycosyltransferase [Candidatus Pelagibacter sp. HIMB1509]|uniref:glycosyltransferase n=1 Tax=Candidatus Pelagibacter sp. HIMB1509 TaxID=3413339 RepID=UPI003F844419